MRPFSRETFRRQTVHQLVAAGIALYNPDDPSRPVNSPKAVYQIEADTLTLLRSFGTAAWNKNLAKYLKTRQTPTARYAKERDMKKLPVMLATGETIRLSPGAHSELIKEIIEEFATRFVPGGVLIYAGDTVRSGDASIKNCWPSWASPLTATARCPTWFFTTRSGNGSCLWNPSPATALWTESAMKNSPGYSRNRQRA